MLRGWGGENPPSGGRMGNFTRGGSFYQVVGIWGGVNIEHQNKIEISMACVYKEKIEISMACVYKEYEVKIKMVQE